MIGRAAPLPADEPSAREAARTLAGCVPASVAYGFFAFAGAIDVASLRSHTAEVAALGLSGSVFHSTCLLVTGIALALPPAIATKSGGRDVAAASRALAACLLAQAAASLVALLGVWAITSHLSILGLRPDVTAASAAYLRIAAFALLPIAVFAALREYAMAMGARLAPAVIAAGCLGLKLVLNLSIVGGAARPLAGAALTTLASYLIACACLLGHLWRKRLVRWPARASDPAHVARFLARGLPISFQQLIELGAFYATGIMAGWLGVAALATFTVAMNVANCCALLSLSIAQTTGAMVARRAADPTLQRRLGDMGVGAAMAVAAVVGCVVIVGHRHFMADGTWLVAIVIAIALVADAAQMTYGGVLRALIDHRFLTSATLLAWWGLAVPSAYGLAFHARLGIAGVWLALAGTLLLVATVVRWRFLRLVGRDSRSSSRPETRSGVVKTIAFDGN